MAELDEILRHDPAARDQYRLHAAVHMALDDKDSIGKILALPAPPRSPRWLIPLAAAAAAVAILGLSWWSTEKKLPVLNPSMAAQTSEEPAIAITITTTGVRWNLPQVPAGGESLHHGRVSLSAGDLSLSMLNGPEITVRGPAEFDLLGSSEFNLISGQAAFRTRGGRPPFILHVGHGAVVDHGGEFAANATPDGDAQVRVFNGEVTISTLGQSGGTLEEWKLPKGKALLVASSIIPSDEPEASFLRIPLQVYPGPSTASDAYPLAIRKSTPVAYWRFETMNGDRMVPDEISGSYPLQLNGNARLEGGKQKYLAVNPVDASGFASNPVSVPGLDTPRGRTVEFLMYSTSERTASAVALEQDVPVLPSSSTHHAPDLVLIERTGRTGEDTDHIHPDFSIRGLTRSPAGYDGGVNLYSRESHLLYHWVHVALTSGPDGVHLFIDGELSDQASSSLPNHNVNVRAIVGRLQPDPRDQFRQWSGAIDELALYDRPLSAAEIKAHAKAVTR